MDELTALTFLAQQINDIDCRKQGYSCATLWLVTSEEKRKECLGKAERMIEDWRQKELKAKAGRDELTKGIKIRRI